MNNLEDRVEAELSSLTVGKLIKWGVIFIFIMAIFSAVSFTLSIFGEAAQVAKSEFGAKASLKKYEWFKDASQQLIKLNKDINIYQDKVDTLCRSSGLDRVSREQCMVWSQELAGIKSARNDLVAEYNAQSNKFNWSVYNVDNLPAHY